MKIDENELCSAVRKKSKLYKTIFPKHEDDPLTNFSKILDKIFIGNQDAAKDFKFFKKYNIKAVVNCSKDIKNYFPDHAEYIRLPVNDNLKKIDFKTMTKYLPSIVEFIYKNVVLDKSNILVHCAQGRIRSVTVVVCFLMKYYKMDPIKACLFVLNKRPEAFHYGTSVNFSESILNFYYNKN